MQRFKDQDGNLITDLQDHLRELDSKYTRLRSKYRKIRERPLVVGPPGLVGPAGPRGFPGVTLHFQDLLDDALVFCRSISLVNLHTDARQAFLARRARAASLDHRACRACRARRAPLAPTVAPARWESPALWDREVRSKAETWPELASSPPGPIRPLASQLPYSGSVQYLSITGSLSNQDGSGSRHLRGVCPLL